MTGPQAEKLGHVRAFRSWLIVGRRNRGPRRSHSPRPRRAVPPMGDRLDVVQEFHAAARAARRVPRRTHSRSPGGCVGYRHRGRGRATSSVFIQLVVGIPERMDKLTRLRHAQRRIVRVQRRLWLAEVLMWPTVIAAGVSSVGGLVWFLRQRSAGGRHEMPDTPGAHEDGNVHVEPDGQLTRP